MPPLGCILFQLNQNNADHVILCRTTRILASFCYAIQGVHQIRLLDIEGVQPMTMQYIHSDDGVDMGRAIDQWLAELPEEALPLERQFGAEILGQWARNGWQFCDDDSERIVLNHFLDWARRHDISFGWPIDGQAYP